MSHHAAGDAVAILDAGSQYGKLIDRCVRELNVRTELLPLGIASADLAQRGFKLVLCRAHARLLAVLLLQMSLLKWAGGKGA